MIEIMKVETDKKSKRGRPGMDPVERHSGAYRLRMNFKETNQLNELSDGLKMAKSDVIRLALIRLYSDYKKGFDCAAEKEIQ